MTSSEQPRGMFVGVQVSPLRITAAVFDATFHLQGKSKRSTKAVRGGDAVAARVARAVADALDEAEVAASEVNGVGIALCGEFSPQFASEERPVAAQWRDASPLPGIQEQLQLPVHLLSVGAAAALGVQVARALGTATRGAVVWIEAELAAGFVRQGELDSESDDTVVGADRWLDWGERLRIIPGKKRYRRMGRLLAEQNEEAKTLFVEVVARLRRVLTRCLDHYRPEAIALVGLGAEELKEEIISALCQSELGERLASAGLSVPALRVNACQAGAAAYAAGQATKAQARS